MKSRRHRLLRGTARLGSKLIDRLRDTPEPALGPGDLRFEGGPEQRAEGGSTILSVARALDLDLPSYCGGGCSCGTCRVEVLAGAENLSPVQPTEALTLGTRADEGCRLACQARLTGGAVTVRIPPFIGL